MSKTVKEPREPARDASGVQTRIREGGLRYQSKAGGSPYASDLGMMISCFLCGRHRPRSALRTRRLLGRNHAVCADGCGKG